MDKKKSRVLARQVARQLSSEEIKRVGGGDPQGPTFTGTNCHYLQDGSVCCGDSLPDQDLVVAASFGGGS